MRGTIGAGAVLVGLLCCGAVSAQVTTNTSPAGSFVVTQVPTSAAASSNGSLLSGFKFANILSGLTGLFSPGPSHSTAIPNPGTPDYLKAFGYQRIGR